MPRKKRLRLSAGTMIERRGCGRQGQMSQGWKESCGNSDSFPFWEWDGPTGAKAQPRICVHHGALDGPLFHGRARVCRFLCSLEGCVLPVSGGSTPSGQCQDGPFSSSGRLSRQVGKLRRYVYRVYLVSPALLSVTWSCERAPLFWIGGVSA